VPVRPAASSGEHFRLADRLVVEEAPKGDGLVAVRCQRMQAHRRLAPHRFKQLRPQPAPARITKPAKILRVRLRRCHVRHSKCLEHPESQMRRAG
jgi:hypothetical protein